MGRVKKRDFILKFSEYQTQEVEIIGKNNITLGVYTPDLGNVLANKLGEYNQAEFVEALNTTLSPAMILMGEMQREGFVSELSDKAQKFQELKNEVETITVTPKIQEGMNKIAETLDEIAIAELFGQCKICKKKVPELWIVWEDGEENEVCKECIGRNFTSIAALESHLRTLKKVELEFHSAKEVGETKIFVRQTATYTNFNPQPKPIKKEKKKS